MTVIIFRGWRAFLLEWKARLRLFIGRIRMRIFIYPRALIFWITRPIFHRSSSGADSPWRLASRPLRGRWVNNIGSTTEISISPDVRGECDRGAPAPMSISIVGRPELIFQVPKRPEKPRLLSRGGVTTFTRPVIISRRRIVGPTGRRLVLWCRERCAINLIKFAGTRVN